MPTWASLRQAMTDGQTNPAGSPFQRYPFPKMQFASKIQVFSLSGEYVFSVHEEAARRLLDRV